MSPAGIATVARQEFRLRIRAGRWRWLLATFFLVLVAFTVLLRVAIQQLDADSLPYAGTILYGGLMLFVLGLALLVVPALAAQSVNGDRERGTLATLQVTRLTAGEITLGKFVAAWGTSLVFLALTLPLVAYAMTQGGVPITRVVILTMVVALLMGTVCAVSLWLSSVLARTTTSGVLAYLAVFAATIGTLITFGLVTAVTAERTTRTFTNQCPPGLPPDSGCVPGTEISQTSQPRTDRTWWLLAPNPFVILADAAPQLPVTFDRFGTNPVSGTPQRPGVQPGDIDPLGQIGRQVRSLRSPPPDLSANGDTFVTPGLGPGLEPDRPGPLWPTGLAVNVVVGVAALLLTSRRLRTPSRTLPRGQRVA